eukprot:TRINITY_DN3627_c0_g1_i11.p2 TRINITY_DN3627_c0_g1~~TRINITY_DN3627_c0_g1_i11.p2  ORF type:complete len:166 (-),score=45.54 TRINITY_DN3627_c0_g1_i11:157-654(-)
MSGPQVQPQPTPPQLGTNLWFFNNRVSSHHLGLRTPEDVSAAFFDEFTNSSLNFPEILEIILKEKHNRLSVEHVVVVLESVPPPEHCRQIVKTLVQYIYELRGADELGVTFLQVGCDEKTELYVRGLRRQLEEEYIAFSVVEGLSFKDFEGLSLHQFVMKCLVWW